MNGLIALIFALTGIGVTIACTSLIKQIKREMTMSKVNNQIMNICNLVEKYNNGETSIKDRIFFYPLDQSLRGLWYDPREDESFSNDYEYVIHLYNDVQLRGIVAETGCKSVIVTTKDGKLFDVEESERRLLKDFVNIVFESK